MSTMQLNAYTAPTGVPLFLSAFDYKEDLEKVVVTAYAQALANAASFKNNNDCLAWVNTEGCIWTPTHEDPNFCFECEAVSVSVGVIEEIDAIAEASALSSCFCCRLLAYLRE